MTPSLQSSQASLSLSLCLSFPGLDAVSPIPLCHFLLLYNSTNPLPPSPQVKKLFFCFVLFLGVSTFLFSLLASLRLLARSSQQHKDQQQRQDGERCQRTQAERRMKKEARRAGRSGDWSRCTTEAEKKESCEVEEGEG